MRIGWIVPGYQGGADEPGIPALSALARTLSQAHDLRIFSVRFPPRDDRYHCDGADVRCFGAAPPLSAGRSGRQAASLQRWLRVLDAVRLAHAHAPFHVLHGFWATESGMLAALAGRALGVPVLVSLCGGELAAVRPISYGAWLRAPERWQVMLSLHLATCIGVGSADTRSRLVTHAPWLHDKVRDLPLGFDPATFNLGATGSPVHGRVVCVASWSPVKGHELLLDAVRLLVDQGVALHLVLVGEGTDGAAATAAIGERALDSYVTRLGRLAQQDVASVISGAQVSAICSWHEAECLAVVESLACGVQVVATPVGIARSLLTDPVLGAVVPGRSAARFARALAALLERTTTEARDVRARRARAVQHLALPQVAECYLAAYRVLTA